MPVEPKPVATGLGAALEEVLATIAERAAESADRSYTAQLMSKGVARCAQKLGEEAVEAAIAAAQGDREGLVGEAADLLYHLGVLLAAAGVPARDVASELARRRGASGLEEKARR